MSKYFSAELGKRLAREQASAYLVLNSEALLLGEDRDTIRSALACEERQLFFVEADFDFDAAMASAAMGDLFGTKILLEFICAEPLGAKAATQLADIAAQATGNGIAMLVGAPGLARRGKWTDRLDNAFEVVKEDQVPASRMAGWIKARARKERLEIDDEAASLLASLTEGNLSSCAQELSKLAMLHGPGANIDLACLRAGVADYTRDSVFSLREAMAAGDTRRALRALRNLRAERVAAPMVVWALAEESRALLTLANGGRTWGVFGKHLGQLQDIAKRVRPADVLALLAGIARADWAAKGVARIDPWICCERLAVAFTLLARSNRLEHHLVTT